MSLSPYCSERTKRRQLANRVQEIMNQLKSDVVTCVDIERDEFNITNELAHWAVSNNISQKATTDLLKVLHPSIPDFPNDSRTLVEFPRIQGITLKARSKTKLAEKTSNIDSKTDVIEKKRKRKTKKETDSSSDEEITSLKLRKEKEDQMVKINKPIPPSADSFESLLSHSSPYHSQLPHLSPQVSVSSTFDLEKAVSQIITNQEIIMKSLNTLCVTFESMQKKAIVNADIPEGINLPIPNDCEFASTEELLKDVTLKNQLISALAPDGGYNLETTIRRLMKHLLTDEMGRRCNLSGQHGKMAFGQSEMMNVVFGVVMRNPSTSTATIQDCEVELRKWFGNARDRGAGSRKRNSLNC